MREGGGGGEREEGEKEREHRKCLSLSTVCVLHHSLQLFQLGMDLDQSGREPEPITGLHLEPRKSENNGLIYYIVVATPRWGITLYVHYMSQ